MKYNIIKIRGILSSIMFVLFIITLITSIGLFFKSIGLGGRTLIDIHIYVGFLFIFVMAIHFLLNYKMLVSELKNIFKK